MDKLKTEDKYKDWHKDKLHKPGTQMVTIYAKGDMIKATIEDSTVCPHCKTTHPGVAKVCPECCRTNTRPVVGRNKDKAG